MRTLLPDSDEEHDDNAQNSRENNAEMNENQITSNTSITTLKQQPTTSILTEADSQENFFSADDQSSQNVCKAQKFSMSKQRNILCTDSAPTVTTKKKAKSKTETMTPFEDKHENIVDSINAKSTYAFTASLSDDSDFHLSAIPAAKELLSASGWEACSSELVCREKELAEIESAWNEVINNASSGSVYLNGPPGTGKTATLRTLLKKLDSEGCLPPIAWVNCMSVSEPNQVFTVSNIHFLSFLSSSGAVLFCSLFVTMSVYFILYFCPLFLILFIV